MKALKILGSIIIGLALLILVLAAFAPSENHLVRSTVINAPIEDVRAKVMSFEEMITWSPWARRDPNQTYEIQNDGAVGALYHWSGHDTLVGEGTQTITSMDENTVTTHLQFVRPWEMEADATTTLEEVDGGVKVSWSYSDYTPYPFNVMNLFMDMDKLLGPDFEAGMENLKSMVEEEAAKSTFNIQRVEMEPRVFIGNRDTIGWDEMGEFFANSFGTVYQSVQESGLEMAGMPSGVYFMWDEENQQADLLAGIPVKEGEIEGLESSLIGGTALMIEYYGPYEGTGDAHMAMDEYIVKNNLQMGGAVIEEYITDPQTEADTSKWLTRIYYPIQP